MFRLEGVSVDYKRRSRDVRALANVTLEIERGDYLAVVGPSGSGKSTLLLALGGMLSPTAGRVLVDGESLYDLEPRKRARWRRGKLGFLFQTFNLVPYLSALENVQVPLLLAGLDGDEQRERAAALLERLGLGERLDHTPAELSVGQQQRVALARVLANDPEAVLADEPTGNLDPETTQQVVEFLAELHGQGRTVVVVTHDRGVTAAASRTVELRDGTLEPAGTPGRC